MVVKYFNLFSQHDVVVKYFNLFSQHDVVVKYFNLFSQHDVVVKYFNLFSQHEMFPPPPSRAAQKTTKMQQPQVNSKLLNIAQNCTLIQLKIAQNCSKLLKMAD